MPRYQTNRMNLMRKFRKPYSKTKMYARKGRAIISQANVGGAVQRMTTGVAPPPEIKTYDQPIATALTSPTWSLYSTLNLISGITQGITANNRIGRKIRVVGIVVRLEVGTNGAALLPWTLDLMWDKQANGSIPILGQNYPYTTVLGVAENTELPNSNFTERYQFVKRVKFPSGQQSTTTAVDYVLKCDKLVSFDGTTGTVADVETNNLLMYGSSCSASGLIVQGNIRILFVDA